MKVLDKNEILEQKMVTNVMNERKILASLHYPLIVNLQCALSTPLDLFMIVDLMQGGDMRYHMRNDKRFTEDRVRFYVAQTALCLNYLHACGYVHRLDISVYYRRVVFAMTDESSVCAETSSPITCSWMDWVIVM
jgi:serine/threonine protein kinase